MVAAYLEARQPREALFLFERMPHRNTVSWNGLISGHIKNGTLLVARRVLNAMPDRNVASWTSMVRGYVQNGDVAEAERLDAPQERGVVDRYAR